MIEDATVVRTSRLKLQALAGLSVEDAQATLRRRWPVVAGAALLGAACLYGASALIPPSYVASAEIFVDPRTIQPLNSPPGQAEDSNVEIIFVESQAHIIGSQSVLSRVVDSEKLNEDPDFTAGSADRSALATLEDRVTVRRPERTFVLEISVKASTAAKAARLANAVAQAYFDEQAAAHAAAARRANQALTDRLDELRDRLHRAEERADAFRRSHGLVGTRTQLVSEQQLTDANTQLAQARSRVIAAQSRLDEVKRLTLPAGPSDTSPEAMMSPTITLLRGQQADAKRRLDKLLAELGPMHPSVRDAQFEVDGANRAVAGELARISESAKVDFARAKATETAQQKVVDDLSARSADASSAITELGEFDREVDVNKNLLNTFLSRARETSEIEQLDTGTARLISTAQPPRSRSFPPRGSLFAAFGFLLGLAAGLLLVLIGEVRRTAVPSPVVVPEPEAVRPEPAPRIRRLADYRL